MAVEITLNVQGMTCDHCARAVQNEIGRIAGVTGVEVDLATGAVTISSGGPIDARLLVTAVEDAGYEVPR
jgi:copper ion binding protein